MGVGVGVVVGGGWGEGTCTAVLAWPTREVVRAELVRMQRNMV